MIGIGHQSKMSCNKTCLIVRVMAQGDLFTSKAVYRGYLAVYRNENPYEFQLVVIQLFHFEIYFDFHPILVDNPRVYKLSNTLRSVVFLAGLLYFPEKPLYDSHNFNSGLFVIALYNLNKNVIV